MKKSVLNIIECVLQIIALAFLFVDGMFMAIEDRLFSSDAIADIPISFITASKNATVIQLFVIAIFAFNFAICLISVIQNKDQKDSILHTVLPILNAGIFFLSAIVLFGSVINTSQKIVVQQPTAFFTVTIFLLLAIVVIAIIKRSNSIVPEKEKVAQIINNVQEKSEAEELKKYKELLDGGVITQEEFDAKKKQLLGL